MAAPSPTGSSPSLSRHGAPPNPDVGHLPYIRRLTRKARQLTHSALQPFPSWGGSRLPYHEYVHRLVLAGWDNLQDLDTYMMTDVEDENLVISVLDITDSLELVPRSDIRSRAGLGQFMDQNSREGVKVRLYLAEQDGNLASGVMEEFGRSLGLDPRFFQWSIHGKHKVAPLSPSQRHRAPFTSITFAVPVEKAASSTDADYVKVTVYIQRDEAGDGWTGILIFNSHKRVAISSRSLNRPPAYHSSIPPPVKQGPKSFRELYIESFEHLDRNDLVLSPFYAVHHILRLNYYSWSMVIASIREEDRRIHGISNTSVTHVEEIKKSLTIVKRGGSLGWHGRDNERARECRESLEEDFQHLVEQTDLLWQAREKMAAIKNQRSEARRTTLVNSFTYIFAPVTIMTGIYGMNVSQITGSNTNPNIWQFFAAVAAMNVLMFCVFAMSYRIHVKWTHGKGPGWKASFASAVGYSNVKNGKA